MGDCEHPCGQAPGFPETHFNRPALEQIRYRIGTYAQMREHLLGLLNQSLTLQGWTHRGADDPGIALLEGVALVGDVLTFYQGLYANEVFLRTADWREDVADLVQLTGYRLAPGVGGTATFALKLKGTSKVTVPAGFGFKVQLAGQGSPAEFESSGVVEAVPHLSVLNLYRSPDPPQAIAAGGNQLELASVDGKVDATSFGGVQLRPGDRLLLVPDAGMFDGPSQAYSAQDPAEIVIVSAVETRLDRTLITLAGKLEVARGNNVTAYLLGRSLSHFGHNAPIVSNLTDTSTNAMTQRRTRFERYIGASTIVFFYFLDEAAYYSTLRHDEMALDAKLDDLASGAALICQGTVSFGAETTPKPFTVVRRVAGVRTASLTHGNLTGTATVVRFDADLITNAQLTNPLADIRELRFHETIGPVLTLRAPTTFSDGAFDDARLRYYGTYAQVQPLAGRALLLADSETGGVQRVRVQTTLEDLKEARYQGPVARDDINPWWWDIFVDQPPGFDRAAFDQIDSTVTVYGNLVEATQGKTEAEVVLGSGDNAQVFQTFAIPKVPLTYLLDPTQTPAEVPELDVYVDGIRWKRIDTFFGMAAQDQGYVVREDNDGKSWVQFGDGKTGARLPSGLGNVSIVYRTGSGTDGAPKAGTTPQATGKLTELERVFLPGTVTGGDDPEDQENARRAAPARMQSLDRLVGLADFEAEALALPGVIKARADWDAPSGVPLIRIVVLTKTGTAAALAKVRDTLTTYNRCRGPARFPVHVEQGVRQFVYLRVRVGYDAAYRLADVQTAIATALGVLTSTSTYDPTDSGVFALAARGFGQDLHRSQILAAVQQVAGVTWVEIDDLQALALGDPPETDPARLGKPTSVSSDDLVPCLPTRVLTLNSGHLDLSLTLDEVRKECS